MAPSTHHPRARALTREQHGVISHEQLREIGYSIDAIRHRQDTGRLFVVHRGVYAVGRRELSRHGRWIAAVLAVGDDAVLSHESAAAWYGIAKVPTEPIHISTLSASRSRDGIKVHRRKELSATTTHNRIPTTTPAQTLIDLSATWPTTRLEAAINEADQLDLIHPEQLREAAEKAGRQGARLRRLLDRQTFRMTESELERRFLRLVRRANLPMPETQQWFGRYRADFHWPDLNLVVEADSGRFHRTAAQQTRDRKKDQALLAQGLTVVRFTHAQIRYEPASVAETLYALLIARRSSSARTKRSRSPSSTR